MPENGIGAPSGEADTSNGSSPEWLDWLRPFIPGQGPQEQPQPQQPVYYQPPPAAPAQPIPTSLILGGLGLFALVLLARR
jgi:hypothetical protein